MTKLDQKKDTKPKSEPLPVGTFVKLLYTDFERVRIIEYPGPLGPGGMRIYRVRASLKSEPFIAEVRDDQIVVIPAPAPRDPKPKSL